MAGGRDPKLSGPRVVQEKPWKALVEAFILGGDEEEKAGGFSRRSRGARLGGPRGGILLGWVRGSGKQKQVIAEDAGAVPTQAPGLKPRTGSHSGVGLWGWGARSAPGLHGQEERVAGSL